ncbi:acyl-[acyl-carrier-protein]--UDP-N-acetylglucosamine O-acyltransferase [Striga asiatica]|uniref:Acyl-[acyl-carrier-protein]--UDP-N-acetylglucosamine O-acyltransferase n=1 Tax=Striga asiatica TaxID=4170 RepID=A0A5A7QA39_STRAF|nr:acyl-[acyl-carrier-protein]--UDP-N-acetylglucosamine O-acyltransferase [Striga asiatica]
MNEEHGKIKFPPQLTIGIKYYDKSKATPLVGTWDCGGLKSGLIRVFSSGTNRFTGRIPGSSKLGQGLRARGPWHEGESRCVGPDPVMARDDSGGSVGSFGSRDIDGGLLPIHTVGTTLGHSILVSKASPLCRRPLTCGGRSKERQWELEEEHMKVQAMIFSKQ